MGWRSSSVIDHLRTIRSSPPQDWSSSCFWSSYGPMHFRLKNFRHSKENYNVTFSLKKLSISGPFVNNNPGYPGNPVLRFYVTLFVEILAYTSVGQTDHLDCRCKAHKPLQTLCVAKLRIESTLDIVLVVYNFLNRLYSDFLHQCSNTSFVVQKLTCHQYQN